MLMGRLTWWGRDEENSMYLEMGSRAVLSPASLALYAVNP